MVRPDLIASRVSHTAATVRPLATRACDPQGRTVCTDYITSNCGRRPELTVELRSPRSTGRNKLVTSLWTPTALDEALR